VAAVTLLGTISFDTASGTKTVVATPAVNDLIVIVTAHTGYTGVIAPTDNNADGLGTYTQIGSNAVKVASADRMQFWVRDALVGSATSTTFTTAPGTTTGGGLAVLKVTGMSRAGASAIRGSGLQSNQAAGGTPAPALPAAATGTNPLIGAVFNGVNPATMTPPATFDTERGEGGYNTPATGLEVASDDTGNTDTTVTWGSTSGGTTQFCSFVVELDSTAAASATAPGWQGGGWWFRNEEWARDHRIPLLGEIHMLEAA
jgi:hypothetical protein